MNFTAKTWTRHLMIHWSTTGNSHVCSALEKSNFINCKKEIKFIIIIIN